MKLLFILLPLCAAVFTFVETGDAEISPEQRAVLQKAWGMDPEIRRARLERIAKKATLGQDKTRTAPVKNEIPARKIEKPKERIPGDIFETNSQLGIDKYLFQGDIHLTEEQLNELEREMDGNGRRKRQAKTLATRWPDNTVYFYFSDTINEEKKEVVHGAHKYIQDRTCINFVENATATNRIRVFNGIGCYSAIGMTGGEQVLSMGYSCEAIGIAAHEFTHALGFVHTHARSDRDDYVTVDTENIKPGSENSFQKLTAAENELYTPYEYGSFMHYTPTAFAGNKSEYVLLPHDMQYLYTMGHIQISFYDIQMINEFYGCTRKCPAENAPQCQNGGYPNPRDCSKCNCPAGFGGDLCDQRPPGCGETLVATSEWQEGYIEVGDNSTIRIEHTVCNHWITAPEGKKIQMEFWKMRDVLCVYGCKFSGIEIKKEENIQQRNPLICCDDGMNKIINSTRNPTPVVTFSMYYQTRVWFNYRYVDGDDPLPPTEASTKTPSTTTQKPSCFDIWNDYCPDYVKSTGSCEGIPSDTAKKYCAKSCGFCGEQLTTTPSTPPTTTTEKSSCFDIWSEYCPDYFQHVGSCDGLAPSLAEEYCKMTCGYCNASETTSTPTTTTTPAAKDPNCKDRHPDCARIAQTNRCQNLDPYIREHACKKSCGYC